MPSVLSDFSIPDRICGEWSKSGSFSRLLPRKSCRFRLRAHEPTRFRLHLHKMSQQKDCRSDSHFYLTNQEVILGPYCPDRKSKTGNRKKRDSDEILQNFEGKEVDVLYFTAPTGHKFRFKFNFEWEMFPGVPGSKNQLQPAKPVKPVLTRECAVGDFISAYNSHSDEKTEIWRLIRMITWSLKNFSKNINDYDDFCTPEAKYLECYDYESNDIAAIISRIKFEMNHVTKFCKEGFGWQWKKALGQLQKVADAEKGKSSLGFQK